jgi:Uncharacterized protein conserved in bacteria (DUF2188)
MNKVTYEIVEHDGGWAYRVGGVYSETFPTHDAARRAAERAAHEQILPDATTPTANGTTSCRRGMIARRPTSRAEARQRPP